MTGCEHTPTTAAPVVIKEAVYVKQEIPAGLLTCAAEPVPSTDRQSIEDSANAKLDIATAGRDCRAKLNAVRGLVTN